jgi:hypothetical protein
MNHYYEFFDRAAVDRLWRLSWNTVMKRNRGRWFWSTKVERGAYGGENDTLRGLLAFAIEPEPSDKRVERMLARLSVGATARRCHPQFWAMDEIMRRVLSHPAEAIFFVEVDDISGLVAVAARAFLDRRITAATLWTVVKLHSAKPGDWLGLDSKQSRAIDSALPWHRLWEPIYSWQDERACSDDDWTNCLGVSDTRRFADFVMQAYRENWGAVLLGEESQPHSARRFRDFPGCVLLAKSMRRKLTGLQRPCVYRTWE